MDNDHFSHTHHIGCSCGCDNISKSKFIFNGKKVEIKGLIETLISYLRDEIPLDKLDTDEVIDTLLAYNKIDPIDKEALSSAIIEEYRSMLPE